MNDNVQLPVDTGRKKTIVPCTWVCVKEPVMMAENRKRLLDHAGSDLFAD
ncbi:MAG: hypothetical protein HGJ94_18720 [Desulfosarcina sp.]|nr:hypothetical protein [Desulfosarcina sp.]MBC2743304.1 hypothetical protein [Desulfosarcina sp.]MBC2766214.1 hypothetical protein [Desulfosarcina sp.]